MTSTIFSVLSYALIPAVTITLGGALATLRAPGPKIRSGVQHFAAGLVFAAVAVEILPDMMHERKPVAALIGFTLGVALMLLVKHLTERMEQEPAEGTPPVENRRGLLVTLGIDVLIDGLLIGVSFAAGAKAGVILTVALAVEVTFLGLAAAVALSESGAARTSIIGVCAELAGLLLVGAAVGATSLHNLSGATLEGVLAFGCAALLYLVIEELMVEAHEEKETPTQTAMFFVGFILLLVTEMIA
jgi:ZIP family zinc transporter